jgi:hypothetical protein
MVLFFAVMAQFLYAHEGPRVELLLQTPSVISAGIVQLQFQLLDRETNNLLPDQALDVLHEKKLHLLIYDEALQEFQHVHPEFTDGHWTVEANFQKNGKYWLWSQGQILEDEEFTAGRQINIIDGQPAWPAPPVLSDQRIGDAGISTVELGHLRLTAGHPIFVNVRMKRNDGTAPELTPYLGAFAHIVAVPQAGDSLIHVHPMPSSENQGIMHVTFPLPGFYRVWVQFIDGGELKIIPLSVQVF